MIHSSIFLLSLLIHVCLPFSLSIHPPSLPFSLLVVRHDERQAGQFLFFMDGDMPCIPYLVLVPPSTHSFSTYQAAWSLPPSSLYSAFSPLLRFPGPRRTRWRTGDDGAVPSFFSSSLLFFCVLCVFLSISLPPCIFGSLHCGATIS